MSRQLDQQVEDRTIRRHKALIRALEYGLVGALESQGATLCGIGMKFDEFDCLMTLKARMGDVRKVAFVGSDTIISCFLKAEGDARNGRLRWREDKYG